MRKLSRQGLWRDLAVRPGSGNRDTTPGPTPLSTDEARQVLGRARGESSGGDGRHRRLIHKLSTPIGGLRFLAAKITRGKSRIARRVVKDPVPAAVNGHRLLLLQILLKSR